MEKGLTTYTLAELTKAGVLFLVMGGGLLMLWNKLETYDKEIRQDMRELKKETLECRSQFQYTLIEQVKKTTNVIERNTFVIENIRNEKNN